MLSSLLNERVNHGGGGLSANSRTHQSVSRGMSSAVTRHLSQIKTF